MVSIIIPCYNNGKYLVKMIDCFRRQTSSDWELIIVDDGSTDETPLIVERSIKDLSNACFYRRNRLPKGSVVCRNIGFEHARGEYVCHLDADDLVSNSFVEHRVCFMESHPDVDYATFLAKVFTDDSKQPVLYTDPGHIYGQKKGDKPLLYYFLKSDYPFSVWNNIYRKEAIKDLKWDEKVLMSTDFSYIIPCILKGLKHEFCDDRIIDYYYRHDTTNKVAMTSNPVSVDKCKSTRYLLEKTMEELMEHGLYDEYKDVFFSFFMNHFKNLVLRKTTDALPDFYLLCKKYYSTWTVLRLKWLANISLFCHNSKAITVSYYSLGMILFCKKEYANILKLLIFRF